MGTNYEDIHEPLTRRVNQGTRQDGSKYRKVVGQGEGLKMGMTTAPRLMCWCKPLLLGARWDEGNGTDLQMGFTTKIRLLREADHFLPALRPSESWDSLSCVPGKM